MPTTEIITIINNSGKVISTGKQLVNVFKEAQAAYRDRKDAIKAHRAGIQRAKTFDVAPRGPADPSYFDDDQYHDRYGDEIDHAHPRRLLMDRRRSQDDHDDRSHASSRASRRSRRSHRPDSPPRPRPALTAANLKTHSEVSATPPSKALPSPYAETETAPRDMQLSRPALAPPPSPPASTTPDQRQQLVRRPRSNPDLALARKRSVDMDLAYGDVPPDLESRVDLDHSGEESGRAEDPQEEAQAISLLDRIEKFLEEAHCIHYSASSMIESLQQKPEAAAAVALSLAELSALLGKMSPAFLGFLKGGSPAVFALLASPQFLIGTGIAVGVTVVMFGGWKIVKRMKDSAANKTLEAPFGMRAGPAVLPVEKALPPAGASATATSYDEAVVLEEEMPELSAIETWRRGIVPFGGEDNKSAADVELMSREAERALRDIHVRNDDVDPGDSVSQAGRSAHSSLRSSRSYRSHRHRRHRHRDDDEDVDIPKRKSSRNDGGTNKDKDRKNGVAASEAAASERSHRSHRSGSDSAVSRSSKHSSARTKLKAIEEGEGGREDGEWEREEDAKSGVSGTGRPKEKKRDMIKQLFKMKKDREDREREKAVSVLV